MLSEEEAMEILETYDLTRSFRSTAALCGVDCHTVRPTSPPSDRLRPGGDHRAADRHRSVHRQGHRVDRTVRPCGPRVHEASYEALPDQMTTDGGGLERRLLRPS